MNLKSYKVRLINHPRELEKLADFIQGYGTDNDLAWRDIHDVMLTLEELVTNVISYGYDDDRLGEIHVELAHQEQWVTIFLIDNGRPFNPLEEAPKVNTTAPLEERAIGGLGLHLVKNLMDSIDYQFAEGRNHLTLRKELGRSSLRT